MALPSSKTQREYEKFVELPDGSTAIRTTATTTVENVNLSAEMKVDSGHDLYLAQNVARTADLAVSFDSISGLTLTDVQAVENKTKGWVYNTKGATVTATAITLVAANQPTGCPVIEAGDEIEVVYRGTSRFDAIKTATETTATDTTSIDGKITACDTSSIAGIVTANAGTDLNTSALALESGGKLDDIKTAVELIDNSQTAPTSWRSATVDETAAQEVKASAGTLHGFNIYNPNAYDVYVKLYDTAAASVVVGTTAIVQTIQVPAEGSVYLVNAEPIQAFSTAIAVACTKLAVDSDTTAITSDVLTQLFYK